MHQWLISYGTAGDYFLINGDESRLKHTHVDLPKKSTLEKASDSDHISMLLWPDQNIADSFQMCEDI